MTAGPLRVVVTDLDGTIVRPDGTLSAATVAAIAELQRRGIPLVIATARTPAGLAAVEHLESATSVAVCCTGALGWSPADSQVLWTRFLIDEAVGRVVGTVGRFARPGLASFDGRRWRMTVDYRGFRGTMPRGPASVVPIEKMAAGQACTMAVRIPGMSAPDIAALLVGEGTVPGQATLTWAIDDLVDIAPSGVDKASGVGLALDRLGMTWDEAVAFGDMPNDLPMLRSAAVGVAVEGAPAEVVAAADLVGGAVAEDGFAATLRSLGLVTEAG
jgi:hydroxymethylpyrimidine pyrophosphatase-like HAD family hydrolase